MALNEQRLRFVLTSPSGPVGRHLANKGVQAESAAKALATAEGLVRSGGYRSSIKWRLLQPLAVEVLADAPQSRIIERGSAAHTIKARGGGLWWEEKSNQKEGWARFPDHGRPVPSVSHPGTKPYLILTRAVRAVFAR